MQACPANLFQKNPSGNKSVETYSEHATEYDSWFEGDFHAIVDAELQAVEQSLRAIYKLRVSEDGFDLLEIGMGTGRFALHLKKTLPAVQLFGLEPASGMAQICRDMFDANSAEVSLIEKTAEQLDTKCFNGALMDCVLFVTTFGFLEDHEEALMRVRSILRPGGVVCVAFINGQTAWGQEYLTMTSGDKFYSHGTCILNPPDVEQRFQSSGFNAIPSAFFQTLLDTEGSPLNFTALCNPDHPALAVHSGVTSGMWSVMVFQLLDRQT